MKISTFLFKYQNEKLLYLIVSVCTKEKKTPLLYNWQVWISNFIFTSNFKSVLFSKFRWIKVKIDTSTSEILLFFVHNNSYSIDDINDDDQNTYEAFVTGNVNTFSSLYVQLTMEKRL